MDWKKYTIGEFAARYPGAIPVFKKKKVDFCCGGDKPLSAEIEQKEGLKDLLEIAMVEIKEDSLKAKNPFEFEKVELVDYILEAFHEKHKKDLPQLIELAKKIESVHALDPNAPAGLAAYLEDMEQDLYSHMQKEEMVLFPMIKADPAARPLMPIKVMMAEHDEHKKAIEGLENLAHGFRPPEGACYSWQTLYQGLETFVDELKEHIHTENNILFPKVLEEA